MLGEKLKEEELEKTVKKNREIFIQELLGEVPSEERTDYCYFCGKPFKESEAEFCERCGTFKCVHCGGCFCDLSSEAKRALDMEMVSLGIWENPWHNPPRRKKKRKKPFEMTRSEFLSYVERAHPDLYTRYAAGELDFSRLHGQVMARIDRTIRIKG